MKMWVLDEDFWLLRLYASVWRADPAQADLCKLFWGVLFAPLGLLLTRVVGPLMLRRERRKARRQAEEEYEYRPPRTKISPDSLSHSAAKARWNRPLQWLGRTAAVVVPLGLVGALVYVILHDPWAMLRVAVTIVGVLLFLTVLFRVADAVSEGKLPRLRAVGRGARDGGRVMWAGAKAFKHATCPQVVVREKGKQET